MTAKIDPELERKLADAPDEELEAIVTSIDDLEALLASLPDDVRVGHRYKLIKGASITATARTLERVARMKSVKSIESVRPVRACS